MKKAKCGFLNWYCNLVDKQRKEILELTLVVNSGEIYNSCYLIVEAHNGELYQEIQLPKKQVIIERDSIRIGENYFSKQGINLNIISEASSIIGEVQFNECKDTKQSKWYASIMGPARYMPFLKSYHDVISLSHELIGSFKINNESFDFTGGIGYAEKEWGKEYPKTWIWAQCNHFKRHDMSLMIGIARMPIWGSYYTVFSVPVHYKGQLEVFSSYNSGQIAKLYRYKQYVHIVITQKSKVLDIKIFGEEDIPLTASRRSHKIRDVYACQNAKIEISIIQNNHRILDDIGYLGNIEIGGNTSKLK